MLMSLLLLLPISVIFSKAIPVTVVQDADGNWQLLRGGRPYYVLGAGGDGSKELLAASGANTFRTWSVSPDLGQQLDQAQELGLAVIVGHWLGHERHGFNYQDKAMVEEQTARVRRDVVTYKDHPALLLWGIGNETEGIGDGDNPALWTHVQQLAAMIKELDPNHPTMVVTAEIGGKRVESIHKLCPDIDIMGINSYGGLPSLPGRYKALGGSKPYIVTEFGPPGVWETTKTGFDSPQELTSTQKAVIYEDYFRQGCLEAKDLCLGGLAFIWGSKPEATATWFGMLLPNGDKLAAVDAMAKVWSGKAPQNLCPEIKTFKLVGTNEVHPGDRLTVKLEAIDPEGAELEVNWSFCTEAPEYLTFGETWWQPLELGGVIVHSSAKEAELLMPGGGLYRLYVTVRDKTGGAATANIPLKVIGESCAIRLQLPVDVYADNAIQPWTASGWMGDYAALSLDLKSSDSPYAGDTCLEVHYKPSLTWVGVAWQNPPNDWGDLPGGYDLTGATKLTFRAKGKYGGEVVDFGIGLLGADTKYPDTASAKLPGVKLSKKWKLYQIDLKDQDLSRVKTPFYWTMPGKRNSTSFYLDNIRFE